MYASVALRAIEGPMLTLLASVMWDVKQVWLSVCVCVRIPQRQFVADSLGKSQR